MDKKRDYCLKQIEQTLVDASNSLHKAWSDVDEALKAVRFLESQIDSALKKK